MNLKAGLGATKARLVRIGGATAAALRRTRLPHTYRSGVTVVTAVFAASVGDF